MLNKSDLTPEQNDAITRLYEYDETLLVAGTGFGKAVVGLTALQELIIDDCLDRVLVLAPLKVATLTWGTEPDKWGHLITDVAIACGTAKERHDACMSDAQIVVTNFENTGWILDHYGHTFDALLVDEMSKLKNAGGSTVKKLRSFVRSLVWRCGMSATPVAESGIDIYAQALLLDLGKALGTRKDRFLRTYFYPTDYNEYNWELLPGSAEKIGAKIRSLVFMADDAAYKASLPPLREHYIRVPLSDDARDHYEAMTGDSVVVLPDGTEVVAVNAAVQSGKLNQIAAGGLYCGTDERDLVWSSDFKLAVLRELVAGMPGPVIVVYQFGFERDALEALYPDAPVLGGGAKFTAEDQDAWNAGEHPVMIMHPRSAAHGLNFQLPCFNMVYMSPLWSADGWIQSIARIRRRGTPFKEIHRWVLGSEGTVEDDMLTRIEHKASNERELMAAIG